MMRIMIYAIILGVACGEKPLVLEQYDTDINVRARFVQTKFRLRISAKESKGDEVRFTINLPDTAFISSFKLRTMPNDWVVSEVQSKEDANRTFHHAQEMGLSAGQVIHDRKVSRRTDKFAVPINVPSGVVVEAQVEYQQLLARQRGVYAFTVPSSPFSISTSPDLAPKTTIQISDSESISKFDVKSAMGTKFSKSISEELPMTISWPAKKDIGSVDGLTVQYELGKKFDIGTVLRQASHYIHFFSPDTHAQGYDTLRKAVVFTVDISGSMSGSKMEQARDSMNTILCQLHEFDIFGIVLFNHEIQVWPEESSSEGTTVTASIDNIGRAKDWLDRYMHAGGSTNIYAAIERSHKLLSKVPEDDTLLMAVLLSDGEPVIGVTDTAEILRLTSEKFAGNNMLLHTLGFGFDLDYKFMQALAWQNSGEVRRIYDDMDAAEQLDKFFDEINSPVLRDLRWDNWENEPSGIVYAQSNIDVYFGGSELIVAWKSELPTSFRVSCKGRKRHSPVLSSIEFKSDSSADSSKSEKFLQSLPEGFTSRLWAHLRIRSLLMKSADKSKMVSDSSLRKDAIDLAIKHKLVTPLTSLVAVDSVLDKESKINQNVLGGGHMPASSSFSFASEGQPSTDDAPFVPSTPRTKSFKASPSFSNRMVDYAAAPIGYEGAAPPSSDVHLRSPPTPSTDEAMGPPSTDEAMGPPSTDEAMGPPSTDEAMGPPSTDDASYGPLSADAGNGPLSADAGMVHLRSPPTPSTDEASHVPSSFSGLSMSDEDPPSQGLLNSVCPSRGNQSESNPFQQNGKWFTRTKILCMTLPVVVLSAILIMWLHCRRSRLADREYNYEFAVSAP